MSLNYLILTNITGNRVYLIKHINQKVELLKLQNIFETETGIIPEAVVSNLIRLGN